MTPNGPKNATGSSTVPELRVNGLVEESIVDGPGLRCVVFTQGCPHHCAGCHNPDTHAPDGGYTVQTDELFALFSENPLLSGITFSGGEPFLQPEALCAVAVKVKAVGGNVMTYTGYTFEQLCSVAPRNPGMAHLLALTDILVDGPYVEALRDLEGLRFRGSSNQRLLEKTDMIHLAQSLGDNAMAALLKQPGRDLPVQAFAAQKPGAGTASLFKGSTL